MQWSAHDPERELLGQFCGGKFFGRLENRAGIALQAIRVEMRPERISLTTLKCSTTAEDVIRIWAMLAQGNSRRCGFLKKQLSKRSIFT